MGAPGQNPPVASSRPWLPSRVLPIAAGAGSMRTAGGGMVGVPPGPAPPVPPAVELDAPAIVPGDATLAGEAR